MKLKGVILTTDRGKPNGSNTGKFISGVFVVGSRNKQEKDMHLLVCTTLNKCGTMYKLKKENIDKIFLRFIGEGKCTFRFKEPPHDVAIKSDANDLKRFMNSIKANLFALQPGSKVIGVSIPMLAPVTPADVKKPKESLCITTKKEYPLTKGFPPTITKLVINKINLQRLDTRILKLRYLVSLDLESCSLSQLPPVWDRLSNLSSLKLSNNSLDTLPPEFCQGSLCDTLQTLDLSGNKFRRLPRYICNLKTLHNLRVDNNELIEFPPSIGKMSQLKYLWASNNRMTFFPGSAFFMKLNNLDLSGNFMDWDPHAALPRPPRIKDSFKKLKLLSARAFLGAYGYKNIPKPGVIPFTLVEYLMSFQVCLCNVYATDEYMGYGRMCIPDIATAYTIDSGDSVLARFYMCTPECQNMFNAIPHLGRI